MLNKKTKKQVVVERVATEELSYLQHLLAKSRQAELEKANYAEYLGTRYQMSLEDSVDLITGVITRVSKNGGG